MPDLNPEIAINLALSEVGYKEKKTNEYLNYKDRNAGTNNFTKYAHYMDTVASGFFNGPKNGYDWCAVFFCYLMVASYGIENAYNMLNLSPNNSAASCTYMMNNYKSNNRFGSSPAYGSQIFFGDGDGTAYHTGIVVKVDRDKVYTVEGNCSDSVMSRSYYLTDTKIEGYGYPQYDYTVASKTFYEVANEVILGYWGNNPERAEKLQAAGYDPAQIQQIVNEILERRKEEYKITIPNSVNYSRIVIELE